MKLEELFEEKVEEALKLLEKGDAKNDRAVLEFLASYFFLENEIQVSYSYSILYDAKPVWDVYVEVSEIDIDDLLAFVIALSRKGFLIVDGNIWADKDDIKIDLKVIKNADENKGK